VAAPIEPQPDMPSPIEVADSGRGGTGKIERGQDDHDIGCALSLGNLSHADGTSRLYRCSILRNLGTTRAGRGSAGNRLLAGREDTPFVGIGHVAEGGEALLHATTVE